MIVLYYKAIEIFIKPIRVHISKHKLSMGMNNKPGTRLALIPVQKDELLEDGGELHFVAGRVAHKIRQSFPDG